jgi:cholinesterase
LLHQGLSCLSGNNFGGGTAVNTTGKNLTATGYIILDTLTQIAGPDFSEDCLTINVWTKHQSGERKKAVLIWLYGGGFTSGASADPMYDGEHFVDQEDIVFVSFKYVLWPDMFSY